MELRRPGTVPANVLVVACRTACSRALVDAVARRASESPARFTLLVPRPIRGLHRLVDPEDHGFEEARVVLAAACPLVGQAAGAVVEGLIGSHDPVAAVQDAVSQYGFDEAIISTLPVRLSRWLHLDLPRKVAGMGLRVTTVTGRDQDYLTGVATHPAAAATVRQA